jgi:hypothetical protein
VAKTLGQCASASSKRRRSISMFLKQRR